ncbi:MULTISPECIES: hypothetical protein [unclassified Streptomyces]|uniref:hypothetical protein n=1 Tax=Streptomycetaceae TaxID=2062 RepID=UPI002E771EDA|nr:MULTISPECIES: hypothetical protein [unclassified Streptomyces]MED7953361.1 hypothetical protein [Streptomyces sp. BE303]MEE1823173.1 hypothetical protein [Streptomyces sp. BE20]
MSSSEPVRPALPAAEALRLADRAKAAAQASGRLPGWYGPAFAVAFTVYGTGVGQAIGAGVSWLSGVFGVVFAALTGALARIAMREAGIVHRPAPGYGGLIVLAVLGVFAAAGAASGLVLLAGGGVRWIGAAAGLAAGAAFWAVTGWLAERIRRDAAAH